MNINSEDIDRIVVALAALLHDIGKFEQRSKRLMIQHQICGSKFVEEYLPNFSNNIKERVSRIIRDHHDHTSNDPLTRIVMSADALSASERLRAHEASLYQEDGKNKFYNDIGRRLSSVFNPDYYYTIQPITLDYIPEPTTEITISDNEYISAWEKFLNDV
ncbi:MAG: HD domain-containing protein, partial [Candidatus Nitrosocaldus sp.]